MPEEFYSRPVFRVQSVAASLGYYCEVLGFEKAWAWGEDEPVIAQVGRNGLDIILDSHSVLPKAGSPSILSLSLHAAETLATLHDDLLARGARIAKAPFAVAWQPGVHQFEVADPDGNVLVFWGDEPD